MGRAAIDVVKRSRVTLALALAAALACGGAAFAQEDAPPPAASPSPADPPPVFKPERPADSLPMDTAEQRKQILGLLYGQLAKAPNAQSAAPVAETIEKVWLVSGSDTISLLMERAAKATADNDIDLALKLLDAVTELAPEYAEGWNRRAYVLYKANNLQRAIGDLRRVLALEPNHYKALDGLGVMLREIGEKRAALKAFDQLSKVHPHWPSIGETVQGLTREVEGQGI